MRCREMQMACKALASFVVEHSRATPHQRVFHDDRDLTCCAGFYPLLTLELASAIVAILTYAYVGRAHLELRGKYLRCR